MFSVRLVSCYAHVFVRILVVIVTVPHKQGGKRETSSYGTPKLRV